MILRFIGGSGEMKGKLVAFEVVDDSSDNDMFILYHL
jgi:hypothetical protein